MTWFRHCDRRFPFLWESDDQPAARWHAAGEGPVQYLADSPEGAWAEFIRHEEITDPEDLQGVSRALWDVEVGDEERSASRPGLPMSTLTGGPGTYPECQAEARSLREAGSDALISPSAALRDSESRGYRVELGFRAERRPARVLALFGRRPEVVGRLVVEDGRPATEVLSRVRQIWQ